MTGSIYTKLSVNLPEHAYSIYIGENLLSQSFWQATVCGQQVLIVTNTTVAPLYLNNIKQLFNGLQCDDIILPDGEQYKNWQSLNHIFDHLIEHQHRRNTTLIALGGGVIGDLTGFAAACYQRGVAFIQLPTTLLAQVDSSVGGKTGINHPLGKNMIGAFYQPKTVIIDINTLQTLPTRELVSGFAEIIKVALIADEDFFCWLEANINKLLNKEPASLLYAIQQAVAIKVKIIVADEKEANIRVWLNLGHTFAHGIEHALGYQLLHGEAVALGLILAADYSVRIGLLDENILSRIKNLLTRVNLPLRLPKSITPEQLFLSMQRDKKKDSSELRLILLKEIGQPIVQSTIDLTLLEATLLDNT